MISLLGDFLLGPCIRRIPNQESTVFLTFDDGPDPRGTPAVLEVLRRQGALATFFVIAERARAQVPLLREMRAAGHAIGNHSHDHRYRAFFASDRVLREWILRAQNELTEMLGEAPVGFRSPAGVRTPPLGRQLRALGLPLIHWNVRFFDTRREWTQARALRSWEKTPGGSIVLLHDPVAARRASFLDTLDAYLTEGTRRGVRFAALTPDMLHATLPSDH